MIDCSERKAALPAILLTLGICPTLSGKCLASCQLLDPIGSFAPLVFNNKFAEYRVGITACLMELRRCLFLSAKVLTFDMRTSMIDHKFLS